MAAQLGGVVGSASLDHHFGVIAAGGFEAGTGVSRSNHFEDGDRGE